MTTTTDYFNASGPLLTLDSIDSMPVAMPDQLVAYLINNARGGRWNMPGRHQGEGHRGGRPRGTGRFPDRTSALAALRQAYRDAAEDLKGYRLPTLADVARKLSPDANRSTLYWWFARFDFGMDDLR